MARGIAIVCAIGVLSIAGWALWSWWETRPPDAGDIPVEAITPPGTTWLNVESEKWCDRAVPGYRAWGSSDLDEDELWQWFDDRFGPALEEPTARFEQAPMMDGTRRVYADVQVWIAPTELFVLTYDTVSHDCLPEDVDAWDLRNAWSFVDSCDNPAILFWGVAYGRGDPGEPPPMSTILEFDGDRRIAHARDDPTMIYAIGGAGESWHRYDHGSVCPSL